MMGRNGLIFVFTVVMMLMTMIHAESCLMLMALTFVIALPVIVLPMAMLSGISGAGYEGSCVVPVIMSVYMSMIVLLTMLMAAVVFKFLIAVLAGYEVMAVP